MLAVVVILLFLPFGLVLSAPAPGPDISSHDVSPAVFLLAGDSTTATQSADGGGWGDGFKNYTLLPPSFAINYGHNGATTASFVAGGDWERVLKNVTLYRSQGRDVFVTIQFGHNDQKLANFSAAYQANLAAMASDVSGLGGVPVLVTPLSRRNFFANGSINDSLAPWAEFVREVAANTDTHWIDLWQASVTYLEEIGPAAAMRLNLNPDDHTHLNVAGSVVFGRMVSDLLGQRVEGVKEVTMLNETLSRMIWEGIPSV